MFVALVISTQSTCALLCWYLCGLSAYTIFFHIISLRTRLSGKSVIEHKMCVLIFFTTFVWNVSHSKKNWARYYHNVHRYSCKVPVILVRFLRTMNFFKTFLKNTQLSSFMKIRPLGDELFHANGRTDKLTDRQAGRQIDMTKLITPFSQFGESTENLV